MFSVLILPLSRPAKPSSLRFSGGFYLRLPHFDVNGKSHLAYIFLAFFGPKMPFRRVIDIVPTSRYKQKARVADALFAS